MKSTLSIISERSKNSDFPLESSTGFESLDTITLGFNPGQLVVIGGYPSAKTSFALNFAYKKTKLSDVGVCFVSLADSIHKVNIRLLSIATGIPTANIQCSFLSPGEVDSIMRAGLELSEKKLFVYPQNRFEDIRRHDA